MWSSYVAGLNVGERREDAVDAPAAHRNEVCQPGWQRAGGAVDDAGDARRDRDPADAREDRCEEGSPPDRQPLARSLAWVLLRHARTVDG